MGNDAMKYHHYPFKSIHIKKFENNPIETNGSLPTKLLNIQENEKLCGLNFSRVYYANFCDYITSIDVIQELGN